MPKMSAGKRAPARSGRVPPLETYLDIGRSHGIAWTALRRDVLTLLWRTGEPWGVYALADAMRSGRGAVFPNSLYRILGLFEEAGLVVAVASNRRYQIAPNPHQGDWGVLQCTQCEHQSLIPLSRVAAAVRSAAGELGHATERLIIECLGRCRSCAAEPGLAEGEHRTPAPEPQPRDLAHLS
jgi:Fe2+ or Zn2+ uptake regulation protein